MNEVRRIPRAERAQKDDGAARKSDILPPELAEAIRDFMRAEWKRLRRDELFYLRVGMKATLADIERELEQPPE